MATERIYLDHHATTPCAPEVVEAMLPYFTDSYGNPSSRSHVFGQEAHRAVEEARAEVAALVGASPEEITFTSGATESDNLAVRGIARAAREPGRHLLTTTIEHSAVLEPCRTLEREGFAVSRVKVGETGLVAVEGVADAVRPDTLLVSVMAANNEVGTIQPVEAIGALCRERGLVFHCDGVQALGRIPVDVNAWGVDLLSLSAHKMYGPKGVGALYVRRDRTPRLRLVVQAEGGGQEKGLRSGTLNVPAIVGFGVAARLAREALAAGEPERIRGLRDRLHAGLSRRIDGLALNGAAEPRLPGNLNLSIAHAEAERVLLTLGERLALSSGAACAEAGGKGSHVLRALGLPDERVYTALRFGLGRYNTEHEIDVATSALCRAVEEVRGRAIPAAF
jgi:cysteine desulfurase